MSLPPDLEHLSPAELKGLVIALLEKVAALERTVTAQRDEIARLKNVPGRPAIKPSGMENPTQSKPPTGQGRGRKSGGKKTARRVIHEDRVIKAAAPNGARFKGYEDFVVQDLVFRPLVVRYRRERWLTLDGRTITARCRRASAATSARRCGASCWLSTIRDRSRCDGWPHSCARSGSTSRAGK